MKKSGFFCQIICLLLILSQIVCPVLATAEETTVETTVPQEQPSYSSLAGCSSTDATSSMLGSQEIVKNTKSAFLYEVNTQTLMYAYNPDTQLDPSSLVKLMTALLAVEEGNLQDEVLVKQEALDVVPDDAVSAKLQDGELISLENLLYCMLVGSANDAAAVIAEHMYGSQEAFVERMNRRAEELGCTGTNFVNVTGIYTDSQTMTVRDVAKILEVAVTLEPFMTVFNTADYTVPATNKSVERNLLTSNYMCSTDNMEIYYDSRVTGGRTGIAGDGTRCLAVHAEAGGMRLISVIMGSDSVVEEDGYTVRTFGGFNETKALLDSGFTGFKAAQLFYEGQVLVNWPVPGGENSVTAGAKETITSVLPAEATVDKLSYRYDIDQQSLQCPINTGDRLCAVEIWYGNLCVAQTDLYAMNDVRAAGYLREQETEDGQGGLWWLWILISVLVVAVVVFVVLRLKSRQKQNAVSRKKKRKIPERRRDE